MTDETITDIAALPPADRAMIVLNTTKTEADLKAMAEEAKAITEVKEKADRVQAHLIGMKLKNARTTITKVGKEARDDATAFCKAVIDEEKRLIAITQAEETRVLALRDAYDKRIEDEKAAKAAREADIKGKIAGIRGLAQELALAEVSSQDIAAEREALSAFVPTEEVFGEFIDDCKAALTEADAALAELFEKVSTREQAAAAVAAEQAKLEAERRAFEEERAAYEAEKRAFEERKAAEAAASSVEPSGSVSAPAETPEQPELPEGWHEDEQTLVMPVIEVTAEEAAQVFTEADDAPITVAPFHIRQLALATADQFQALAGKVAVVGFLDFATQLEAVSNMLRTGQHDTKLQAADLEAVLAADNALLDATMNAIDALGDEAIAA